MAATASRQAATQWLVLHHFLGHHPEPLEVPDGAKGKPQNGQANRVWQVIDWGQTAAVIERSQGSNSSRHKESGWECESGHCCRKHDAGITLWAGGVGMQRECQHRAARCKPNDKQSSPDQRSISSHDRRFLEKNQMMSGAIANANEVAI
jgi:hypothetical protein